MRGRESGDPRLQELFGVEPPSAGVRPVVRLARPGPPGWAFALIAGFGAILLFFILESRRETQPQPSVREGVPSQPVFSPEPPPLYIPPAPPPAQPQVAAPPPPALAPLAAPPPPVLREVQPAPLVGTPPQRRPYSTSLAPTAPLPSAAPQRTTSGSALVVDGTAPAAAPPGRPSTVSANTMPGSSSQWGGRVQASALANRSDTVAQGTLIPAVLETAFDSTSAGLARAIVSHDVRGFDGTRILIPRGSRLIGEYGAEVASGQKRALITWTRLIRPDGMMIALDSPATDTLGRGGIDAHVNTHFFARFLNAILRTTVDVGGAIATRAVTGPFVVAVPGMVQNSGNIVQSSDVTPTLTIPAGKSISVFAARDLEFPPERQR